MFVTFLNKKAISLILKYGILDKLVTVIVSVKTASLLGRWIFGDRLKGLILGHCGKLNFTYHSKLPPLQYRRYSFIPRVLLRSRIFVHAQSKICWVLRCSPAMTKGMKHTTEQEREYFEQKNIYIFFLSKNERPKNPSESPVPFGIRTFAFVLK